MARVKQTVRKSDRRFYPYRQQFPLPSGNAVVPDEESQQEPAAKELEAKTSSEQEEEIMATEKGPRTRSRAKKQDADPTENGRKRKKDTDSGSTAKKQRPAKAKKASRESVSCYYTSSNPTAQPILEVN